ncbi:hypothetical protein [Streptomyces sp. NPDC089919]|uniref:hypothetical protein n=1 Tax=Streptomyces sp. NPDC089919 TaxID=3155188 RepID=UPI0034342A58
MSTNRASSDAAQCPAGRRLPGLVARVLAAPGMTAAVAAQVRWVEGTLYRALEQEEFRARYGSSLRDLLGPGATAVCRMTEAGLLRARELTTPPKGVTASQRRRASVLRRLAEAAGVPSGALSYPKQAPKATLPAWARSELHHRIGDEVERRPSAPGTARFLAVVGLVLDTGARTGELCDLAVADLAPGLDGVRLLRNPQSLEAGAGVTEVWRLSAATRAALAHWLPLRYELLADLEGSAGALLVVLRSNRGPGNQVYKRGMPLRPKGLIDSYRSHAQELKAEVTRRGGAGWELPAGLEQLRRGVEESRPPGPAEGLVLVRDPADPERPDGPDHAVTGAVLADAVAAFRTARSAEHEGSGPRVLRARAALREAAWIHWAQAGHASTLGALREAGLANTDLAAAGYEESLLRALERA